MNVNPPTFRLPRCWTALAAGLLVAGCSLTPDYERPDAPVSAQWPTESLSPAEAEAPASAASAAATATADTTGAAVPTTAAADLPWQDFFTEPALRQIIDLTLTNNRDLRVAIANIEQARAQYQIQRADLFPALGLNVNQSRSAPNPSQALGAGGSVASSANWSVGISSWELDLFGRIRALKDAALAQYLATEEARKSVQMSLIAGIADAWLQLKTDTELLALAQRTLATREQSLQLTQLRFDHGAVSALDLHDAQSLAATARAAQAQQQRLRAQDINALVLLAGVPAESLPIPPIPPVALPQAPADNTQLATAPDSTAPLPAFADVPAGLPSDLLLRRPDIRAAEQQLIAANANIGAARAAFFPRITLTGGLGRASDTLDNLFGGGGSTARAWSFMPSLTLPIFDFGRNTGNLQAAKAAREAAVAQYEKAIQTAFREAADALAGRATYAEQLAALEAQAKAERERYRLSDLSYRNGAASYLNLLDAQRALFATEQAVAQVRLAQRVNEVAFYKALGGGWTEPEPQKTSPSSTAAP
ncbi:MAG: efflux transporter outer membrane subunit [Burkholderiaceae bacterium]|jgi:multidrug efflux system outer membrane protein|nr:efflux transporter outer membrane subunit [Burkholderiaceae bacterium]